MNAKSNNELPRFPKWLPASAIACYQQHLLSKDKRVALKYDSVGMLLRLCTSDDMKSLWLKLGGRDAIEGEIVRHGFLFLQVAVRGYFGPVGEQKLTPKQHEKWLKQIVETSTKLATLIRGAEFDRCMEERGQETYVRWLMAAKPSSRLQNIGPPDVVEVKMNNLSELVRFSNELTEFARRVPKLVPPPIARPNGPDARRAYFIRELTGYFVEYFGKPHRNLVTIATAAAFKDATITERQVTRVAPVPAAKKWKTTK